LFVGARRVKIVEVLACCMVEFTRHMTSVKMYMREELTVCTGTHLICSATHTTVYTVKVLVCEHDARQESLRVM